MQIYGFCVFLPFGLLKPFKTTFKLVLEVLLEVLEVVLERLLELLSLLQGL